MSFLLLNFEIGSEPINFFVFCWIQKNAQLLCNILKSPNLFFILKVPQNTFHSNIENTKIFQYLTPISTIIGPDQTGSDDMIQT